MGNDAGPLKGPDLASDGVDEAELHDGQPLLGHAHGEPVIVVRDGQAVLAVGASCTHYGGPLAEGLVAQGRVHCPWHHACFDLRTGEASAPALNALPCFEVRREGARIKVGDKRPAARRSAASGPASVLIVGAGAAGAVCAESLRREGYQGPITLVGAEAGGPVDRPNLSKDYLAGNAPEEWMPLRTLDALREQNIEVSDDDPVTSIDAAARRVRLTSGRELAAAALVLATGAEPVRLPIEGADLPHVRLLRTLADARAIIARLAQARRAVVIGSGFIGLEAAASLRTRGLEVTVVGADEVPLGKQLGEQVGRFVRSIHEAKGVHFRLGRRPARITASEVALDDGTSLAADLVIMGVGVRPRTALAEAAGLEVRNGIVVDERFQTSAEGVFAIGDVARFPYDGEAVRIEHWQVATRQGQALARALAGREVCPAGLRDVPFFWSQHHDVTLSYVGHAERFDPPEIEGDLAARDATVSYRDKGRLKAVLTVGRDLASLRADVSFETR